MGDGGGRPEDTQEFMAMWHAATEPHLTQRLTDILSELVARNPQTAFIRRDQCAVLAPHILRALQAAAVPSGTVEDGVQLLAQAARAAP